MPILVADVIDPMRIVDNLASCGLVGDRDLVLTPVVGDGKKSVGGSRTAPGACLVRSDFYLFGAGIALSAETGIL